MAAITVSDTLSTAARRTDALSRTTRKHWSWPEHILPAGLAHRNASTRTHHFVHATMRISDSSDSRIHCPHESRFYESGY
jgi:hypothetical protein